MNTASTKMKALAAGVAAMGAFGIGSLLPAQASGDHGGGKPEVGSVGPEVRKVPPGQANNTHDNGWECDDNGGVGKGNPAHGHDCGTTVTPPDYPDGGDTGGGEETPLDT